MKGFIGNVDIRKVSPREYKLLGNLSYENQEIKVTAKTGLVFDGASIPRFFHRLIGTPFTGNYTCSACIHDALYASEMINRKEADKLFLEMLKEEGVTWWKRKAMYYAVRLGGGAVWEKHSKQSIKKGRRYCEVIYINATC